MLPAHHYFTVRYKYGSSMRGVCLEQHAVKGNLSSMMKGTTVVLLSSMKAQLLIDACGAYRQILGSAHGAILSSQHTQRCAEKKEGADLDVKYVTLPLLQSFLFLSKPQNPQAHINVHALLWLENKFVWGDRVPI